MLYNGFRPSIVVYRMSPRQIRLVGIQDGERYIVNVARSDVRQIRVAVLCATQYCSHPGRYTFRLGFAA